MAKCSKKDVIDIRSSSPELSKKKLYNDEPVNSNIFSCETTVCSYKEFLNELIRKYTKSIRKFEKIRKVVEKNKEELKKYIEVEKYIEELEKYTTEFENIQQNLRISQS